MGQIDNLNDPYARARDMKRQQRRSAHATPGNNMSIGRDGLLVYGGGSITIDNNGGITITGPDGQIVGSGTIQWTGTFTNTGPTNLNGPTAIHGTLDVSGITNLLANLIIGTGGKITVAGMTIANLASGIGGITWGTTFPSLYSDGSSVAIGAASTRYVSVGSSGPAMVNGTRNFAIDASSHFMTNMATSTVAANMYVDSAWRVYKTSSARRFKIGPKLMKLAPSLLDVRMKDWIDKGARKRGEPDVRIPGVIAEEVAAAGGEQFVTRDADGVIEGVAYDRLALARTQILADRLDAALKRIDELEKRLAA